MKRKIKYCILLTVSFFALHLTPYTLHVIFAQEPIVLPPVVIKGQDKSTEAAGGVERSPGPIIREVLPRISREAAPRQENSFFTMGMTGGGYNYLEWKATGGKQAGADFLITLDRISEGDYGVNGRLQSYSSDNFSADFSFPVFKTSSVYTVVQYFGRDELFTHPALLQYGGNVLKHWTRSLQADAGWKGRFGELSVSVGPKYSYTAVDDRMLNIVNTAPLPADMAQEIKGGLKFAAGARVGGHAVSGEIYYENESRVNRPQNGNNFTVFIADSFRISGLPDWQFRGAFRYMYLYRLSSQTVLNPELSASCEMKNGIRLLADLKRESVIPGYGMFTGRFIQFSPDLNAEHSWCFDASAGGKFSALGNRLGGFWSAGLFTRVSQDYIAYGDTGSQWAPFNIAFVNQSGPAVSAGVRLSLFGGDIVGKADYKLRFYSASAANVPYLPRDELSFRAGYELGGFSAYLDGNFRDAVCADTTPGSRLVKGYCITSLDAGYTVRNGIKFFFSIENIFDLLPYEALSDYPCKGRSFKLGTELKF